MKTITERCIQMWEEVTVEFYPTVFIIGHGEFEVFNKNFISCRVDGTIAGKETSIYLYRYNGKHIVIKELSLVLNRENLYAHLALKFACELNTKEKAH